MMHRHTIGYGYQFNERRTLAMHSSASARGTLRFNAQYTGDGFADYLRRVYSTLFRGTVSSLSPAMRMTIR